MDVAVVETETFFGEAYGPVCGLLGLVRKGEGRGRGRREGRGVLCIGMKTGFGEDVRV